MINRVHERALRVILGDNLFQNSKDIWNHYKNIQSLMIEIFKIRNDLAPPIIGSMFESGN